MALVVAGCDRLGWFAGWLPASWLAVWLTVKLAGWLAGWSGWPTRLADRLAGQLADKPPGPGRKIPRATSLYLSQPPPEAVGTAQSGQVLWWVCWSGFLGDKKGFFRPPGFCRFLKEKKTDQI
jgi:hypothetical protein